MTGNRLLSAAVLVGSLTLLGCGGGGGGTNSARVSGALTYNGKPIKGGVMMFHGPGGVAYQAQISPDGTYSATDIGAGEMVVTVDTESVNPEKMGGNVPKTAEASARMAASQMRAKAEGGGNASAPAPSPADLYVKIPAKYAKANTSTCTVTLKPGRQVLNIDLTD
jgi:hypothetical protein